MPLPDFCDDDAVPCCTTFYDVADGLRVAAYAAVSQCLVADGCTELETFVTIGQPVYAPGDYLATWIDPVAPAYRPPSQRQMNVILPRTTARVWIRLVENAWPAISADGEITVPSPGAIAHAARFSYAHGEKMVRSVYRYMQSAPCSSFEIEQARGFIEDIYAVWEMSVQVSLDL